MNRRVFVSQSIVLSCGSMGLSSIANGRNAKLQIEESGIKRLINNGHLKDTPLSDLQVQFLESLKGEAILNYSDRVYTYGGNFIVNVEVPGILFKKKGLLFVLKDKSYSFMEEKYLDNLNDLVHSYDASVKDHHIKTNTTDFLFPNKFVKNSASPFAYQNKYGNTLLIEKAKGGSRIYII
jgi:hypothetical protein